MLRGPGGQAVIAPTKAAALLYDVGSGAPLTETIYANSQGTETLSVPLHPNDRGEIEFWLRAEREFDIEISCEGYQTARVTTTADSAGGGGTGGIYIDPTLEGTVYGQPDWHQAQNLTVGQPAQPLIDHGTLDELGTGNPHPQYEPAGTAAIGDALHLNAADPHPQYLTPTDGDTLYLTQAQADARYAPIAGAVDRELRTYVQRIMAQIDPGGAPPPP